MKFSRAAAIRRDKHLYLMLIPFLLYYIVFFYKPFGGLLMAFQDYKPFLGISGSKWVGFKNFELFFNGPYFWRVIRNTVLLSVYNLAFAFPIPIILALLFHELRSKRFRIIAQTVSYMPHFISTVVIAGLVVNLLAPTSGLVNLLIQRFGGEPIYFLMKPEYFRMIYVLQHIWASMGFSSIIFYSTLVSLSTELYEAVTIDGGGRWKQIKHVAIPGLVPTIGIMLILQVGNLLDVGSEMIILLYQPATYEVADIISTYVYRMGIEANNYSMSTAVNLFNGVVSLLLVLSANRIAKKISDVSLF